MKAYLTAGLFGLMLLAGCDKSDAEIDSIQNSQCVKWGAKKGSAEYIQCRAILAANSERQKDNDSDSLVQGATLGLAIGMSGRR